VNAVMLIAFFYDTNFTSSGMHDCHGSLVQCAQVGTANQWQTLLRLDAQLEAVHPLCAKRVYPWSRVCRYFGVSGLQDDI
jgi:hypothetical protein